MARKTVWEKLQAARQIVNSRYDLTGQELNDIAKDETKDYKTMIVIAFRYGYLQGSKATKKELEKARAKARNNT